MSEFFNITKKSEDTYSLTINGEIGSLFDDWLFDGNTLDTSVKNELERIPEDVKNLEVRINSPGGSMTVGYSIYNQLKALDKNITTINLGDSSSIASVIFLAGDQRIMPDSSMAVIHLPWHVAVQNLETAKQNIQHLEAVTEGIRNIYLQYLNISEDELNNMMKEETMLTANKALEIGFSTSKTLPTGVSLPDDIKNLSSEVFASRVGATKEFLQKQKDDILAKNNKTEIEVNSMSKKDEDTLENVMKAKLELEAKLEVAESAKASTEEEFKAYKANHKEVDETALRTSVREEIVAEMKAFDEVKAKASGFEAKGDTAEELMKNVLVEGGVSEEKASLFEGDQLKAMFDYVITNKPNQDADDDYSAFVDKKDDHEEDDSKGSFWDNLNKKSKGDK